MTTRFLAIKFGPKGGHGGRGCRGEMEFSTQENAEAEGRGWLNENRGDVVDIRRCTYNEDGVLQAVLFIGQMRWDDRGWAIRHPYPDT